MITNELVNRAIEYILKHINEDISVEDVATACHFSKYHFSRIFKAETGESIYAFIKRVKVEQSAFRLKAERERSITDIGYDYGYGPSNFSSVFKQHLDKTPIGFRRSIGQDSMKHPFFEMNTIQVYSYEECNKCITIEHLKDFFVIYERRIGNYSSLSEVWDTFIQKYETYYNECTLLLERTFDDPSITDVDSCLYDICMTVDRNCPLENTCLIEGGKFAIYHFKGHMTQIYEAYQSLFQVWITASKYQLDERYGFEIYRKIDCETMNMEIDICLPVK